MFASPVLDEPFSLDDVYGSFPEPVADAPFTAAWYGLDTDYAERAVLEPVPASIEPALHQSGDTGRNDMGADWQRNVRSLVHERRDARGLPVVATAEKRGRPDPLAPEYVEGHRSCFVAFCRDAGSWWGKWQRKGRHFSNPRMDDDCWIWKAGRCSRGTPRYSRSPFSGTAWKEVSARRLAWALAHCQGAAPPPVPMRLYVTCGTALCVNPAHLSETRRPLREDGLPGTDKRRGNGGNNRDKNHCPNGHSLLDPENVYLQRNPNGHTSRVCKQCRLEARAATHAAKKKALLQ